MNTLFELKAIFSQPLRRNAKRVTESIPGKHLL